MAIPVALRGDFKASQLRGLARKTKDGPQARRLLAVAAIYDGATRTEAAKIGGVGLQIIRDWVMRFNARGAAGLLDGKSPGQPSKLNDVQRQAIVRMIESGPIAAIHGVVRWRLIDLSQWIYEEFRITVAKQTLSRELRAMGYRKLSARPAIMRKPREQSRILKKISQRAWVKSRREKAIDVGKIEIWFQDEARIGQKNKITRRWAKRGTRRALRGINEPHRPISSVAICPKLGKGAALILPSCNTEAMNLHLAEIAKTVAPGAHAVLLVDQAGWHLSARLLIPANITFSPCRRNPPNSIRSKTLAVHARQLALEPHSSNSYDDIVDHCCYAWNTLVDRPWKIMSIGLRQWAHGF